MDLGHLAVNKQYLAETKREIFGWPGVTLSTDDGGKHDRITLHYGGRSQFVVTSNTPSDARGIKNHISIVRRVLAELGAVRLVAKANVKLLPPVPATIPAITKEENVKTNNLAAIFEAIEKLRYAEMLELASALSDAAVVTNLRRSRPNDWAALLHSVADGYKCPN